MGPILKRKDYQEIQKGNKTAEQVEYLTEE